MKASNISPLYAWWHALGPFSEEAALSPASRPEERIASLLRSLLRATGARRALVIQAEPRRGSDRADSHDDEAGQLEAPIVLAAVADDPPHTTTDLEPSRSVLRYALEVDRPRVDRVPGISLCATASVRALDIRRLAVSPVQRLFVEAGRSVSTLAKSRGASRLKLRPTISTETRRQPIPRIRLVVESQQPWKLASTDVCLAVSNAAGVLAAWLSESPDSARPSVGAIVRSADVRTADVRSADGASPRVRAKGLAGDSPEFRAMLDWTDRVAVTRLPVWIAGETGTGKEAVARRIHAGSPRSKGPFIALNCAALPDALLESELFGVRQGAFTGADRDRPGLLRAATSGSFFLDEIGDMPAALQSRLLRSVQERSVRAVGSTNEEPIDVRWICASHLDLGQQVRSGKFRRDLFHRLCTLQIDVPPVRNRRGDLPILVDALRPRLHEETGHRLTLQPSAWHALETHSWPGNVRELHGVLAAALLRADGGPVEALHCSFLNSEPDSTGLATAHGVSPSNGMERCMIQRVFAEEKGCVTRTAARIGWTRGKLYRRLRHYGLKE